MFMKPAKHARLHARADNVQGNYNYILEPKDRQRYPTSSDSLPPTSVVIMHDSLQFFNPSQILSLFLQCPDLTDLYATAIIPPEACFNLPSLYPDVYRYEIEGNHLHYHLEKHQASSYTQPLDCLNWLRLSSIQSSKLQLSVTLIDSVLTTHLFHISRGNLLSARRQRTFDSPLSVLLPQPIFNDLPLHSRLVPYEAYHALFNYVRAVRTLRQSDPAAHIRALRTQAQYKYVHSSAWDQLVRFANSTHSCHSPTDFAPPYQIWPYLKARAISALMSNAPTLKNLFIAATLIHASLRFLPAPWLWRYIGWVLFLLKSIVRAYQHLVPQFQADVYLSYFHPEPFRLTVTAEDRCYHPTPFLPLPLLPPTRSVPLQNPSPSQTVTPKLLTPPAPPPTVPNPPDNSPENSSLSNPSRGESMAPPPVADEPHPTPSSLQFDVSASGLQKPFFELYPHLKMPASAGYFLSRLRKEDAPLPPFPLANTCLFTALATIFSTTPHEVWNVVAAHMPDSLLLGPEELSSGYTNDHLNVYLYATKRTLILNSPQGNEIVGPPAPPQGTIYFTPGHWSAHPPPEEKRGAGISSLAHQLLDFTLPNGTRIPFTRVSKYTTTRARAKNLISNLKNGTDGVLYSQIAKQAGLTSDFLTRLDAAVVTAPPRSAEFVCINGFPGCGKTYPLKQFILKHQKRLHYRVITPTCELRSEWRRDLKLQPHETYRISTWETGLTKQAEFVVVDEIYKLPRGYLDLLLLSDPTIKLVVVLGDPCQGTYHSLNSGSNNYELTPEAQHLRPFFDLYCLWSHRIPQNLARLLSVNSYNRNPGSSLKIATLNAQNPTLIASLTAATTLNNNSHHAFTFSGSQGLTFDRPVQLVINRDISQITTGVTLVALTRSRVGTHLFGATEYLGSLHYVNSLLEAYSKNISCPFVNLFQQELAPFRLLLQPLTRHRGGAEIIPLKEVDFLPPSRLLLHRQVASALPEPTNQSPTSRTSHPPLEPCYFGLDYETELSNLTIARDVESFEIWHRGQRSNQFPFLNSDHAYGPFPPSTVSPKHNSRHDPTLLSASISKRLRFRPTNSTYRFTSKDVTMGKLLFSGWLRAYPGVVPPWNPTLFAECINLNDYAQLSKKTQLVLQANEYRSDPDWRYTFVRIFSKTQHKINANSLFSGWKACQTLALMHDCLVLFLGPVKKYQRIVLRPLLSPKVFIYGGHTPIDLSHFAFDHFSSQTSLENDYTAFDQSQRGEAVLFECHKMRHCNLPAHFATFHLDFKTNMLCQFGPLTCMRLTGEPGTYDDNSDYNLAVLINLYEPPHLTSLNHVYLISGDDSVIHPAPRTLHASPFFLQNLLLIFKPVYTKTPLFCGYYVGPAGAIRAPTPLLHKIAVALADQSIANKIESYLQEFVVGHSLGDCFWQLLPTFEHRAQAALFDFFCRRASKQLKLLLKVGPIPEEVCLALSLSHTLDYSDTKKKERLQLIRSSGDSTNLSALPPDPASLEGVLQLSFQS
jgi:hypothetical protein